MYMCESYIVNIWRLSTIFKYVYIYIYMRIYIWNIYGNYIKQIDR